MVPSPPETDPRIKLFVQSYIESGFNATAAAKRSFNLGSRGGKDPQRTAESMGSEYLRKPEVRELLAKELHGQMADGAFVLENLLTLAMGSKAERDRIKATELIGKTLAIFTDRHEVESKSMAQLITDHARGAERVDWDTAGKHLAALESQVE